MSLYNMYREKNALDKEELYDLKARVDKANHQIYQVSRKTGLNLMPYIINEESISARHIDYVTELVDVEVRSEFYTDYSHHDYSVNGYMRRINEAISDLKRVAGMREELLEDFQHAWDRVKNHGEGVTVHYGLRNIYIRVPLETICKYDMYIKSERDNPWVDWERAYFGKNIDMKSFAGCAIPTFDILKAGRIGEVIFKYEWVDQCCVRFDDRSDFLGWKVSDYQKSGKARKDLQDFYNDVRRFQFWENVTFPESTAPL